MARGGAGAGRAAIARAGSLLCAVLALLATGSAGAQEPGRVRKVVDVDALPWRGVGRLQMETGGWCTGALIGPRSVLTAAHCLFSRGTGRPLQPGSIHFLVGYRGGDFAGHSRAASFVFGAGFALGLRGRPAPAVPWDADWAVITLAAPLGGADRVLPVARAAPAAGAAVALGGYEQDRAHALVADLACTLVASVEDPSGHPMLRHDCAATRGSSGAPVLAQAADGRWSVVGVASLAADRGRGGYAVPIAAIDPAALGALP